MSTSPPVNKLPMHVPPLEEVVTVLTSGLQKNFANVSVDVVDCPDLTQDPFMLTCLGLCGNTRLADIGGPGFLLPLPQTDKLVKNVKMNTEGGVDRNNSHIAKVNTAPYNYKTKGKKQASKSLRRNQELRKTKNGGCILEKLKCPEFCLMGNFLCCDGKPGKVIEVKASKRTGEENFMSSMRKTLNSHYGDKPVALGGAFLVEKGKANLHIMRRATALADDLRKEYGDLPIDLNPNPPRRGTFECTIFKDDDTEVLVWTGVKKGPPSKLKFPEDSDVVVKEIEKNLV